MQHEVQIRIEAPVHIAWSVLSDVEAWPEWTASVRSVELLDGRLELGARVRIRQPKFPAVVWRIAELEDGHSFTWRSRSPGADAHGRHTVLDNGDGTSTAVLSIAQTGVLGSLVGLLSRRITKRYVALEAAGLKSRSELRAVALRR